MERYLCPCCGESLLVHVRGNNKTGFCLNCYQDMPLLSSYHSKAALSVETCNPDLNLLNNILSQNSHNIEILIKDSIYGNWIISDEQITLFINPKLSQILGYSVEEIKTQPFWKFIDEPHQISQVLNSNKTLNQPEEYELKLLHKQGYEVWVKLSLTSLIDDRNQSVAYLIQVFDLTYLKQIEHQLQQRTTREQVLSHLLQAIRSSSNLQTIFTTAVNQLRHVLPVDNIQIVQYLPIDKTWINRAEYQNDRVDLAGKNHPLKQSNSANSPIQTIAENIATVDCESYSLPLKISTNPSQNPQLMIEHEQIEEFLQHCPGAWLPIPLYCQSSIWGCLSLVMPDHQYQWQTHDITFIQSIADQLSIAIYQAELHQELEQTHLKFSAISSLDLFTQLPNRYGFNQHLNQTWQQLCHQQHPLTTILCHVDQFSYYQKTYGDRVANECLKQIASIIGSNFTDPVQMIARYGQSELALLLPNTKPAQAVKLIETLQMQIEQLKINLSTLSKKLTPSVSFGMASLIPRVGLSPQQLLANAEQALDQGASPLCKCLLV
ncbi:MAG: diguanylate cyclase [Microcoleaceae cyanobacterium]